LALVAALATDSGYTARPGGKTAWFTLTAPGEPALPAHTAGRQAAAGACPASDGRTDQLPNHHARAEAEPEAGS
jgi:hypothetical protein